MMHKWAVICAFCQNVDLKAHSGSVSAQEFTFLFHFYLFANSMVGFHFDFSILPFSQFENNEENLNKYNWYCIFCWNHWKKKINIFFIVMCVHPYFYFLPKSFRFGKLRVHSKNARRKEKTRQDDNPTKLNVENSKL